MGEATQERGFVVCVRNEGYEASLELHKIYRVIPDPDAENDGVLSKYRNGFDELERRVPIN